MPPSMGACAAGWSIGWVTGALCTSSASCKMVDWRLMLTQLQQVSTLCQGCNGYDDVHHSAHMCACYVVPSCFVADRQGGRGGCGTAGTPHVMMYIIQPVRLAVTVSCRVCCKIMLCHDSWLRVGMYAAMSWQDGTIGKLLFPASSVQGPVTVSMGCCRCLKMSASPGIYACMLPNVLIRLACISDAASQRTRSTAHPHPAPVPLVVVYRCSMRHSVLVIVTDRQLLHIRPVHRQRRRCQITHTFAARTPPVCSIWVDEVHPELACIARPMSERTTRHLALDTAAASTQPDWLSLPANTQAHIIRLASTWQAPGPCWAAPVCRMWDEAAAGCRRMHLLYRAGEPARDQCFAAWLGRNSHRLSALTVSSKSRLTNPRPILCALADASEAAAAGGRPLPLYTLRVIALAPWDVTGRLLASLPNLRTLQLRDAIYPMGQGCSLAQGAAQVQQHLAPLQQATQLQNLYLWGPGRDDMYAANCNEAFAELLPASLKRLSWHLFTRHGSLLPALTGLTQLTYLQLFFANHISNGALSNSIPDSVQELQVLGTCLPRQALEEQQERLTWYRSCLPILRNEPNIVAPKTTTITVSSRELQDPAVCADIRRLKGVSALHIYQSGKPAQGGSQAVAAVASTMPNLRSLHLQGLPVDAGLGALTGLTKVVVGTLRSEPGLWPHDSRAVAEICVQPEALGRLSGLKWLSVPEGLLKAGQAWLHDLRQLQVLVVQETRPAAAAAEAAGHDAHVAWLEGCTPQMLPPELKVLGLTGMVPQRAAAWQQRHRLRRVLGSSGCEVVVGLDLDEVADPTQQLAGWPMVLQQALQ